MLRCTLLALLATATTCLAEVSFNWAYVGNAGNEPDVATLVVGASARFGAVGYDFVISKHEVTNAQYVEFLNAVDPTGANALGLFAGNTVAGGGMPGNYGGIENTGATDGARYIAQPGREQNPVTYVSFFDAMRFTNWLHNGQGNGSTETGAYAIGNETSAARSPIARYWIPPQDEWYKAAYHDASAGVAGAYFAFATGDDGFPVSDQPGDNPAAVNFQHDDGIANGFNDGYAATGSSQFPEQANPLTDVGAYTQAVSPYGTYDQNGNVAEWTDSYLEPLGLGDRRPTRGGMWFTTREFLHGSWQFAASATEKSPFFGFRVASLASPIGDYDNDGMVSTNDYNAWFSSYGTRDASLADGNRDGVVDAADYTVWRDALSATLPSATIPEPTTAALATLAVTALAARRRLNP